MPICASCKQRRDDKGSRHQPGPNIRDHSEAAMRHGICPKCAERLYSQCNPNKKKCRTTALDLTMRYPATLRKQLLPRDRRAYPESIRSTVIWSAGLQIRLKIRRATDKTSLGTSSESKLTRLVGDQMILGLLLGFLRCLLFFWSHGRFLLSFPSAIPFFAHGFRSQ